MSYERCIYCGDEIGLLGERYVVKVQHQFGCKYVDVGSSCLECIDVIGEKTINKLWKGDKNPLDAVTNSTRRINK